MYMCFFEKCVGFRKLFFVLMKYSSDICIKASMNAIHRRCFVFIAKNPHSLVFQFIRNRYRQMLHIAQYVFTNTVN